MFGRSGFQRTVVLLVALLLTGGSTHAAARGFHAVEPLNEDHQTLPSLRFMGDPIHERACARHDAKVFR